MTCVTLSFDNGPDRLGTPYVCSVLGERGMLASFFVIAERLRDAALRNVVAECHGNGHWIGNHTLSHSAALGTSDDPAYAASEIGGAQDLLDGLVHPDRLFRPHNEGLLSPTLLSRAAVEFLKAGRYTMVLWNVVPGDWWDAEGWPDRALSALAERERALVVLHDTQLQAVRRLPRFLDEIERFGYSVTQDFPPECVPMRRGEILQDIGGLVGR